MRQLVTNLLTRDLARSTSFYQRLLGFEVIKSSNVYVLLGTSGSGLALCLIDWVSELVPRAARGVPEGNYLSLLTDDIEQGLAVAREFEVEIIEATPTENGTIRAVIRDLDGRVVELTTPAAHLLVPPEKTVG